MVSLSSSLPRGFCTRHRWDRWPCRRTRQSRLWNVFTKPALATMLKVTVELCPPHGPSRILGYAEIENVTGDEKHADYAVTLFEGKDEQEVGTATLTSYPRFSGSVWDLVARGIATALAGKEELPPRPVFLWK